MKKFVRKPWRWISGVVLALNQFGNALLGGDPQMTISARSGYARAKGAKVGTAVCHVLDWLDYRDADGPQGDHCAIAIRNYERAITPRNP